MAANGIGGFQSSFSSSHFCRRCYISFADRSLPISPSKIIWRTSRDHDEYLYQKHNDRNTQSVLGIVKSSVLKDLEGFHPTRSLPGDCMHDFTEGCCPMIVMALLKEASARRLITYGSCVVLVSE